MAMQAKKFTLEIVWPELDAGLTRLMTNLADGIPLADYMNLYSLVYNYCTTTRAVVQGKKVTGAKFAGEELYLRLRSFLQRHLKTLCQAAETRRDDSLLNFYKKEWDRYIISMRVIDKIFQYLNRHWIKREIDDGKSEVFEVYTLSLVLWKQFLFEPLKGRLITAIQELIEKERNGEFIDTTLVKGCIDIYVSLGIKEGGTDGHTLTVYNEEFCESFYASTEAFYNSESSIYISNNSVCDYMRKAEKRLDEETARLSSYLHPSSKTELIQRCCKALIDKHKDTIWHEFPALLQNDKLEDVSRMYSLLHKIPHGLAPLKDIMQKHIQLIGEQEIHENAQQSINEPQLYVETILKVHKKFSEMVTLSFKSNEAFVEALDVACRRFINENSVTKIAKSSSKSPELIAKYTDMLLKKSPKNLDETEVLNTLSNIMIAFKYIEDRDVFQTFYTKMLAKRLINGTSANEFLEGQMITKLKQNCGYEYTTKLARMFSDMSLSKDLSENFKNHIKDQCDVDFSVLVLATGSWPLSPPHTTCNLPSELEVVKEEFLKFYINQYNGRKLSFLTQVSKGEVKCTYSKPAQYLLQCSFYQMAILVLFNTQDNLTAEDIQTQTTLTKPILLSTLATLHKTKVLLMDTPTIMPTSKFRVNKDFKSKKIRVLINIRVPDEPQQGQTDDQTHQIVEEDRRLQIQAAIVRIMKARKQLQHANLMSEVILQLQSRFRPKVPIIKKCIDILIEKEYLSRSETQKDLYSYVA
jgi:cullin 1